jgi:hypothetical protein
VATVRDIVKAALLDIDAIDIEETPDADEYADAATVLTRMFAGWTADGMTLLQADGVTAVPATLALNDTFPLAQKHEEGVGAMLAVRLARVYGAPVDPELRTRAKRGKQRLYADFATVPTLTQERPIYSLGHSPRRGIYLG